MHLGWGAGEVSTHSGLWRFSNGGKISLDLLAYMTYGQI
jgi:hypothetical protein